VFAGTDNDFKFPGILQVVEYFQTTKARMGLAMGVNNVDIFDEISSFKWRNPSFGKLFFHEGVFTQC
jgi:hypothetical protein